MRYLLDTNVISELAKPSPNAGLIQAFAIKQTECVIATITLHEIRFGIDRIVQSKRRDLLEVFWHDIIIHMPSLPYTREAAIWHANERARLITIGKPSAYAVGQIAAIATCAELILVTANTLDFVVFQRLKLENWLKD